VQLDPDASGHQLLSAQGVGVEIAPVTRKPFALVNQSRVFVRGGGFEAGRLAVEHQFLEGPVGRMQDGRRGRFVDLA